MPIPRSCLRFGRLLSLEDEVEINLAYWCCDLEWCLFGIRGLGTSVRRGAGARQPPLCLSACTCAHPSAFLGSHVSVPGEAGWLAVCCYYCNLVCD